MAYPKTLGACIDLAYKLRAQRLDIEKEAESFKEKESALKEHILAAFDKSDIEGAKGEVATAAISRVTVPKVVDWDAFYAFIHKKKAWELLERRPSRSAFAERNKAGVVVPGVEAFEVVNLSLTKVGGKE